MLQGATFRTLEPSCKVRFSLSFFDQDTKRNKRVFTRSGSGSPKRATHVPIATRRARENLCICDAACVRVPDSC